MGIAICDIEKKWFILRESQLKSSIRTYKQLGQALGYTAKGAASAVGAWMNGSNAVPPDRFEAWYRLYNLHAYGVTREHFRYDDGLTFLRRLANPALLWQALARLADPREELIAMVPAGAAGRAAAAPAGGARAIEHETRGVLRPPDFARLRGELFATGLAFRLRLVAPPGWTVAVFLHDPDKFRCLSPSADLPLERSGAEGQLWLPNDGPPFYTGPPGGQHHWFMIASADPFDRAICDKLGSGDSEQMNDAVFDLIHQLESSSGVGWVVAQKPFGLYYGLY